ncbi:hypothetical protein THAOC_22013 [Thalassiosira oceanica]|uniref:Uncharacterized protein n=1 Tax=Thalassiosira oceanica TaxID=159749 RepID=K0RZH4_THAOC|nr:hypothetical protein THAOC_22013 [Thalassiosira oceanica]|eukprot:EJK57904.1 hypothetical protein THAOC_22013 [Thalassiosira oceanica]
MMMSSVRLSACLSRSIGLPRRAAAPVRGGAPRSRRLATDAASEGKAAKAPPSGSSGAGGAAASEPSSTEGVPVGATALAAALAVCTVSAGAAATEALTAPSCPAFDPRRERFDQSTFGGRFSKMILACDPALLLTSNDAARVARELVDDWEGQLAAGPPGTSRRLYEAQRAASAALHPDTGEAIPRPFRMSGYVPYNGPICVAMVASTSTPALLFWSWGQPDAERAGQLLQPQREQRDDERDLRQELRGRGRERARRGLRPRHGHTEAVRPGPGQVADALRRLPERRRRVEPQLLHRPQSRDRFRSAARKRPRRGRPARGDVAGRGRAGGQLHDALEGHAPGAGLLPPPGADGGGARDPERRGGESGTQGPRHDVPAPRLLRHRPAGVGGRVPADGGDTRGRGRGEVRRGDRREDGEGVRGALLQQGSVR